MLAGILLENAPSKLTAAANATGKVTKMDSAHNRGVKQHTSDHKTKTDVKHQQSSCNVPKSNCKYVSVELSNHPDTASDITLISQKLWKSIGKPQLTSTKHVGRGASGDCVHITGELPATIRIEEKAASGIIYISNSQNNLLGLDSFNTECNVGDNLFQIRSCLLLYNKKIKQQLLNYESKEDQKSYWLRY